MGAPPPALALVLLAASACGDQTAPLAADLPLANLGEACSPEAPCRLGLLCLDGRCVARDWPRAAQPPEPGPVTIPDIEWPPDALSDAVPDADPDPDSDSDSDSASDPDSVSDSDSDSDSDPVSDSDSDSASASDPDSDAGPDDTGPTSYTILYGEDDAATAQGKAQVVPQPGEGWVTKLTPTQAGKLIGLQVRMTQQNKMTSCGLFTPAFWLPDGAAGYPDEPTWQAAEPLIAIGLDTPQVLLLPSPPVLEAGELRVGVIYEGGCPAGQEGIPLLVTDTSGEIDDAWFWAPQPDAAPWVPGSFTGLEGRWAIRLFLEVTVP